MDMILFAYRLPPPVSPTTLPSVAKLHLKPQITHMYLLMSLKLNEYVFFFSNIMSCLILFPLNKHYFILILNTWCQKSVNGKCQFIFTDRTRPANIYLYTDWITSDLTFSLPHKYIDFHRVKRIRFYQNPFMRR